MAMKPKRLITCISRPALESQFKGISGVCGVDEEGHPFEATPEQVFDDIVGGLL
jgi:hypothetical protein